jgi:dihydrofolate reductase
MKVTLYAATSIDGYIATQDGNSDWISEAGLPYFTAALKNAGCVIVGRKSFKQFEGELYPMKDLLNIVLTKAPDDQDKSPYSNVVYTSLTAKEILKLAESKGYSTVVLVGGGETNSTFLNEQLIDEIIIDIQPIVLGEGIKLFANSECMEQFEKVSCVNEESLTIVKYKKLSC